MPIPFNHSRVTDTVIRVLRYSALISSDESAETIRTVEADLTDVELDALVATLDYGGGGGGGGSTSLDDLYLRVDSDAQPTPPEGHTNFLRVTRWTETGAVENPAHEMASVYWPTGAADTVDMVIGPDTNILNLHGADSTYWTSRLYLGAKRGTGGGDGYFYIAGGPNVGTGGEEGSRQHTNGAFADYSSGNWHRFFYNTGGIYNGADARTPFGGINYMFGGFGRSTNSDKVLFVGEFGGLVGTEALLLEEAGGGDFRIKLNDTSAKTLIIRGSDAKWGSRVHINGSNTVIGRLPGNIGNAALAVFGPDEGFADIPLVAAYDTLRASYGDPANTHVVQIRSAVDRDTQTYNLLTGWAYDGVTGYEKVIRVSSDGTIYSEVLCADGGADLAEWVDSDSVHPAGTVMVINAAGKFVASTGAALATVAGVVTNTPALTMNYQEYDNTNMVILTKDVSETGDVANLLLNGEHTLSGWITIDGNGYEVQSAIYNAETEKTTVALAGVDADHKINIKPSIAIKGNLVKFTNRVLMGMCGQISTSCTTANGDIAPGDLLVSGANGTAQKSDLPAVPGTVLGKALGVLEQPEEDLVEGTVKVLVTLQ